MISEDFYKSLALKVSDMISSRLKINFDMKDVKICDGSFSKGMDGAPKFAYLGLYHHEEQGLMMLIDPKIMYMLSNKMLGGDGIIEEKDSPYFTESELLMGNEVCELMSSLFKDEGVDLESDRYETDMGRVHYFYPDDTVQTAVIKCKLNEKVVGNIYICHQYIMGEPVLPLHTGLVL